MNIYKVSQDINNDYDAYDSFVVACETEEEARNTHPYNLVTHQRDGKWYGTYASGVEYEREYTHRTWVSVADLDKVKVELVGTAIEGVKGIICASYNAE